MGENLDSLKLRELQHLEQQLDSGLKRIRSRKVIKLKYIEYKSSSFMVKW